MSKILDNVTGSPIVISDTGATVDNVVNYTIPPQDYLLWAASSDIITEIGAGNIVVNDGSNNLSISDGTDLIKDIFPKKLGVLAGDDFTPIGHVSDALKVTSTPPANGSPVDPVPGRNAIHKRVALLNGSSKNLIVNGSGTPVNFDFTPGAGEIWYLQDIVGLMSFDTGNAEHNLFIRSSALTNGIKIEVKSNGTVSQYSLIKDNYDFISTFHDFSEIDKQGFLHQRNFRGSWHFEGSTVPAIKNSTSDYIRVKIQDNLTNIKDLEGLEIHVHIWKVP